MLAVIGQSALALALLMAAFSWLPLLKRFGLMPERRLALQRFLALSQTILCGLALALLIHAFVISDFSLRLVVLHSHTAKPLFYKISGAWGNHEGSLLLWTFLLTLLTAAYALSLDKLLRSTSLNAPLPATNIPPPASEESFSLASGVLLMQSLVTAGFLALLLFTSNPFETLSLAPTEGEGLNPLLQHPGLAFHPPLLYCGYVGFSLAFSHAVAGLMQNRVDRLWAAALRPWVLLALAFLSLGIGMGSWWAYSELGWGGYWFWDPVENASLMPWLSGIALLHALTVLERHGRWRAGAALLALFTFSFCLVATFLVRSGILTSVHAFAEDPARGMAILAFLTLTIGFSLTLYARRVAVWHNAPPPGKMEDGARPFFSREGGLLLNVLLLGSASLIVLLGTVYPLAMQAAGGQSIAVGPPYYNRILGPLAVLLLLLGIVVPHLSWRQVEAARLKRLAIPALIAALTCVATLYYAPAHPWPSALGMGLAAFLAASTLALLFGKKPDSARARRRLYGMVLAHCALALLAASIVASTAWKQEYYVLTKEGETAAAGAYQLRLTRVLYDKGPNYFHRTGEVILSRDGVPLLTLFPEQRFYPTEDMRTVEAAIHTGLFFDYYLVLAEREEKTGLYALRFSLHPAMTTLWLSIALLAAGGLLAAWPTGRDGAHGHDTVQA